MGCLPDASMERNASISMSLLPHLPRDQGGFIHPMVSKSHEVCAVPSLLDRSVVVCRFSWLLWIFSWKAFSFCFFSVLFLSIAGRSNEVCAVPSLVGLEFCALPILFAAFGFLLVSFVIVSSQHFVKASVVAWSLDFIC